MKNHHEVGHFKNRLMIGLLSLAVIIVMAGQSFAATTCSSCHGMPPLDSADGSRVPATGAFKGSHERHLSGPATASDCVSCHSGAAGYAMSHSANPGGKNVIKLTSGIYSKSAFFNQTSVPTFGSCSNVSCHADVYSSATATSPVWGTTNNGCTACHTIQIDTTGPATGSHAKHNITDCSKCHDSATNNTTKPTANHATGKINVSNGYPLTDKHAAGSYTGTCSTASCHDNGQGVPVTTPVWGTTAPACTVCHPAAPVTRSHTKHLSGLASSFNRNAVCADCHKGYVQGVSVDAAKHIDGNVDVYFATAGDYGYPAVNPKGDTPNSCTTVYCHSNGRSTFTPVAWGATSTGCDFCHPNLSAAHAAHVKVSALATATYGSTADNSTTAAYDFGCGNCHPTTVSSHINNAVDLTLNNTHGGVLKSKNNVAVDNAGYTQTAGTSVTCAAAYCHSNGMASPTFYGNTFNWYESDYTGDKCARCHGNSPNTGGRVGSLAHNAHVVAIHADDIFNGVSRKLPKGGGETVNAAHGRNNRSTTLNCNICHALTVTSFANDNNTACSGCHDDLVAVKKGAASIADKTKHVNGIVDVNFIAQPIASKAQVSQTAFAAYTAAASGGWSRNKGMYKTYTSAYDVTKAALSASPMYTTAAGCAVACHNNNTVKWADAGSVTCTSCHTRLK